jgi:hypothetical protein
MEKKCFLCGRNGNGDPLELHHIFQNAYRNKSEKYGLTVWLCGERCHRCGTYAAHNNADTMLLLHQYGQRKAMKEQGWDISKFIEVFGKNYL